MRLERGEDMINDWSFFSAISILQRAFQWCPGRRCQTSPLSLPLLGVREKLALKCYAFPFELAVSPVSRFPCDWFVSSSSFLTVVSPSSSVFLKSDSSYSQAGSILGPIFWLRSWGSSLPARSCFRRLCCIRSRL